MEFVPYRYEIVCVGCYLTSSMATGAVAQADFERATKGAEQNPDFNKDLPSDRPKWIP